MVTVTTWLWHSAGKFFEFQIDKFFSENANFLSNHFETLKVKFDLTWKLKLKEPKPKQFAIWRDDLMKMGILCQQINCN